jgi:type I restriction enzyme R subunit
VTNDLFGFLEREWPEIHQAAAQAAATAYPDPRTACIHARRALELAVTWAFRVDRSLRLPYDDKLSALIHEPTFKRAAGEAVFGKARLINSIGNGAVHNRPVYERDSLTAVRELFHVAYWFARTYARGARPAPALAFDPAALPRTSPVPKQTLEQLQKLVRELAERDEKLSALLADKAALDAELEQRRAEIAELKQARANEPDTHDYSEAETRHSLIDEYLKEAGWTLDQPRDREREVTGMPTSSGSRDGKGYVDYVLWGDDGKPLAVVEAKRTTKSAELGQQQAKLYADCLEKEFGQRPVIFYTNGYEHWLWDDRAYPPRQVWGFYKKAELELLIQRRTMRRSLLDATVDPKIADRYYQARAIRRLSESFETSHERKGLLVMATGSGKTRTVIALCDLLMRSNWVTSLKNTRFTTSGRCSAAARACVQSSSDRGRTRSPSTSSTIAKTWSFSAKTRPSPRERAANRSANAYSRCVSSSSVSSTAPNHRRRPPDRTRSAPAIRWHAPLRRNSFAPSSQRFSAPRSPR